MKNPNGTKKQKGMMEAIVSWWPNHRKQERYYYSRIVFYEDFVRAMMESGRRDIVLEEIGKAFDSTWAKRDEKPPADYFQLGRRPSPKPVK